MCAVAALLVCLLPLAVNALHQRKPRSAFHELVFHGPLVINGEWKEIKPPHPLKPERQKQLLVLVLSKPYVSNFTDWGVRLPNGTLATPEVELVAGDGAVYRLDFAGSFGKERPFFESKDGLPKDKEYTKVRVRCDHDIELKMLAWTTYNPKDLP